MCVAVTGAELARCQTRDLRHFLRFSTADRGHTIPDRRVEIPSWLLLLQLLSTPSITPEQQMLGELPEDGDRTLSRFQIRKLNLILRNTSSANNASSRPSSHQMVPVLLRGGAFHLRLASRASIKNYWARFIGPLCRFSRLCLCRQMCGYE